MEQMKPFPVMLKEQAEEIKKLNEKLDRILDILLPAPMPQKDVKDPEELKADIIATVNKAFENAGVETPIVDATIVKEVE